MEGPSLDQARTAQAALLKRAPVKLSGVGIAKRAGVFGLKVNVSRAEDCRAIPQEVCGVPVHSVEVVGEIKALPATILRHRDSRLSRGSAVR